MIKFIQNWFAKKQAQHAKNLIDSGLVLLPDGSAFGSMSFPLPKDHWLTRPREYESGEIETKDFPKQYILAPRVLYEEHVEKAARWAIRASTDCGLYNDFDPDAMVRNIVYALCGPNKSTVEARGQDTSIEP